MKKSIKIRVIILTLTSLLPFISMAQTYVDSLRSRVERGEYELCIESIDEYLAEHNNNLNALYNRGVVNYFFQERDAFYNDFQRIIQLDPENYDANCMIAKYYTEEQLPDRAIKYLDYLTTLYPDSIKPYKEKTIIYMNESQWEHMAWEATQMIKLNPSNDTYYFYKGVAFYSNKQYSKALPFIDKAIVLNDKENMYFWIKALILSENPDQSKNNYSQAIRDLSKAIELQPEKYGMYTDRAKIFRKTGDFAYDAGKFALSEEAYQNAINDLKTVLKEGDPDSDTHFEIGVCYYQMKMFELARQSFNEVLSMNQYHVLAKHYAAMMDNNTSENTSSADAQLLENNLPGWKSDLSSVPALLEAFIQKENVTIFATKPAQSHGSISNQISSFWNFSYKGEPYTAYHHDLFAKAASTDNDIAFRYFNYAVYKDDSTLVCDISMLVEGESTSEIIIKPKEGRLEVTGTLRGKPVNYTSDSLEAPYNYTNRSMLNAKHGDELTYSIFDLWQLNVTVVTSELKLEDGNMVMYTLDENENLGKTVYNQKCARIYNALAGNEEVSIEVEQALMERGQTPSVFDNSVSLDYWLNNSKNLDEIKVRVIFFEDIQDNLFQNKRLTIVRDTVNPNVAIISIRKENGKFGLAENRALTTDKIMESSLKNSYLIEADSEEIKELAMKLTATEKDTIQKALIIARWLKRNIKSTYEYASQSALETLHVLKGDCSEKSVMFAALCRSVGIPTRQVRGYSIGSTTAGGHAWDAIFVNGRWVEIDPTTGDFAWAGHLELNSFAGNGIKSMELIICTSNGKEITLDKFTPYWKIEDNCLKNRIWETEIKLPKQLKHTDDMPPYQNGFLSIPGFSYMDKNDVEQGRVYFSVYDELMNPESMADDNVFLGRSYTDFKNVEIAGFTGLCYKTTTENLTYETYEVCTSSDKNELFG